MKKINSILISILIVASYLAILNPVSAATLEVGTGKQFSTIQLAIANSSAGDIIQVYTGTYNEDLIIPAGKNNLSINTNNGAIIIGIADVNASDSPLASPNIEILSNGVKISGFRIESPDYVPGFYSSGILIGAKNVEIFNNQFIVNSAGTYAEVSKAIQTYNDGAMKGVDISGLKIYNNTFSHKNNLGGWGYEAIYINPDNPTSGIYLQNNTFSGKIFRAITSERSNTIITNNTIITDLSPASSDWRTPGACQGINVRNYTNSLQSDITISNNIIKGSSSGKGFDQGFGIGQTGQTFANINITGNKISYNSKGFLVMIANGVKINNNEILNNAIEIQNGDSYTLDAQFNWWGSNAGPMRSKIIGNVRYFPWIKYSEIPISSISKILKKNQDKKNNN